MSPPPQPSCMLSFSCNDKRDWEEPGHLKFLNVLQEDAGNNFFYLVPMNIVNGKDNLPQGKVSPPPQPSCMLSFLCNDQRDWEEPGPLKFLNALQEETGINFSYLVPMNLVNWGGGNNLPRGKVFPPLNPHVSFNFYVMIKGSEKSLVIWSVWMPLKRILETISHISSLWTLSIFACGSGEDNLPRGKVSPRPQKPGLKCRP